MASGWDRDRENGRGNDRDGDRGRGSKDKDRDRDKGKGNKGRDRETGKGKDKDSGKGKAVREESIKVQTERCFDFPWASRIIGKSARNLRHVREQTGVKCWVYGDAGDGDEPLRITLSANDSDADFDKALDLCRDILETLYAEADNGAADFEGEDSEDDGGGRKGNGKR